MFKLPQLFLAQYDSIKCDDNFNEIKTRIHFNKTEPHYLNIAMIKLIQI